MKYLRAFNKFNESITMIDFQNELDDYLVYFEDAGYEINRFERSTYIISDNPVDYIEIKADFERLIDYLKTKPFFVKRGDINLHRKTHNNSLVYYMDFDDFYKRFNKEVENKIKFEDNDKISMISLYV